jgi:hypothetical protein
LSGQYWKALKNRDIVDVVLCPYFDIFGGELFYAIFLVGLINIPVYSRTGSILGPFTVTVLVGSVFFAGAGSMLTGLGTVLLLFVLGFAPILVIKRWESGAF